MYCKTAFVSAMNMFIWWSPHFVGPLEVFPQRKSSSTISRAASVWRFDMIDSKFTCTAVRNFSFQGRRLTYTFDLFQHARHRFFFVGSCDVWLLTRYELEGGCTSIVAQDDHGRLIHGRRLPSHSKEEICASKLLGAGPTKSLNMVPNLQSTHRYPISISSYSTSADVSVCFTGFFAPTSRKIQII